MITIQLNNAAHRSYLGHHLTLNFARRSTIKTNLGIEAIVWSGDQLAADCSSDGRLQFILPTDLNIGSDIYVRLFSCDGSLLMREVIPSLQIKPLMTFEVEPQEIFAPRNPQPEQGNSSDGFLQTLTSILARAHGKGVQLFEANQLI